MWLHRGLRGNQISSIVNGSFSGLGSLDLLLVSVELLFFLLPFLMLLALQWSFTAYSDSNGFSGDFACMNVPCLLCLVMPFELFMELCPNSFLVLYFDLLNINCDCCMWLHRDLSENQFSSIVKGSFSGLGSLTFLLVFMEPVFFSVAIVYVAGASVVVYSLL